ncbi:MAG: toxin-antitoxin system YwqK family antitoxin [Bacteroidia bacterium]
MIKKLIFTATTFLLISACNTSTEEKKEITREEQAVLDSLSRVEQRHKADSLKKLNPLLIMPPDSNYTGDYIDKYPSGITKYRGYYRFGLRHGQWVSFYGTGTPWSEQSYDRGKRHGPNIVYYQNSKVRYKGFFKKDNRDSVWTFYDSLGELMRTLVYKNDKEISSIEIPKQKKK